MGIIRTFLMIFVSYRYSHIHTYIRVCITYSSDFFLAGLLLRVVKIVSNRLVILVSWATGATSTRTLLVVGIWNSSRIRPVIFLLL